MNKTRTKVGALIAVAAAATGIGFAAANAASASTPRTSSYSVHYASPADSGIFGLTLHETDRNGSAVSASLSAHVDGGYVNKRAVLSGHEDYLTAVARIDGIRVEVPLGRPYYGSKHTYWQWFPYRGGFLASYGYLSKAFYGPANGPRIDGLATKVTLRGDSSGFGRTGTLGDCEISVEKAGTTWTGQCDREYRSGGAGYATALVGGTWRITVPEGTGEPGYRWEHPARNVWRAHFTGLGR